MMKNLKARILLFVFAYIFYGHTAKGELVCKYHLPQIYSAKNETSQLSKTKQEVQEWCKLKYGMFIHINLSTFNKKEQTPGSTLVSI